MIGTTWQVEQLVRIVDGDTIRLLDANGESASQWLMRERNWQPYVPR